MSAAPTAPIILASTSRWRAELLGRIVAAFACEAPDVDEAARPGEAPAGLAARLARAKAEAVAGRRAGCLVIGSDQVAELDGAALGKPGTVAHARAQLADCSGRRVRFHTAVCLVDARTPGIPGVSCAIDTTTVHFRRLRTDEIERYLDRDEPYDCAGSFKVERLGIALFERVESHDPTALVGLPLISLCGLLRSAGLPLP